MIHAGWHRLVSPTLLIHIPLLFGDGVFSFGDFDRKLVS